MTTRVLFLNQWPQREVVILMEITLRQVFIYYMTYDILHLSQIKIKSCSLLIYSKDTRGRRLYIATQGKHYVFNLSLIIFIKFRYSVILCGTYWYFSLGPKPKTIADFWTMIWQEEVCIIVCLTNLTEGTKVGRIKGILNSLLFIEKKKL